MNRIDRHHATIDATVVFNFLTVMGLSTNRLLKIGYELHHLPSK